MSQSESRAPESRAVRLNPSELYQLAVLQGVSLSALEDLLAACDLTTLAPGSRPWRRVESRLRGNGRMIDQSASPAVYQ